MTLKKARPRGRKVSWDGACDQLERVLAGNVRAQVVDEALTAMRFGEALARVRTQLRSHVFKTPRERIALDDFVRKFDAQTRAEGLHVLIEWDSRAGKFVDDTIPVLMLDYFARMDRGLRSQRMRLAILLDYYFLYVLALLVVRAWDEGDPNANLDRITELLGHLSGPNGSGLRMVDEAATLIFVAISHYEPDGKAYDRLLEKIWSLDEAHRTQVARAGAAVLGIHLRWGYEAYYKRDPGLMRADNEADYPWLFFSVTTLMEAYASMREAGSTAAEREELVGFLLNGLSPDPSAFTTDPPELFARQPEKHARFQELFARYRGELLEEFAAHRPVRNAYSPLGFHFNFPHNVLIPVVTLALLQGTGPNLPMDALLTRPRAGGSIRESPETLARTVMEYAGTSPERRGSRRVMMMVYDPDVGIETFERTMAALGG